MTDKPLTTLEYALLGLVATAPMSGYDVHKVFDTTPLAHFSSSPGAIYPALRRLERRGLLMAALDRRTETRPRRVYSLTEAGEESLNAWLHQPVTRDDLIRGSGSPILRFVFTEGRLSTEGVLTYLDSYRQTLERYLEELHGHERQMPRDASLHAGLALEHGIRGYQSELEWVQWVTAKMKRALRGSRKRRASR